MQDCCLCDTAAQKITTNESPNTVLLAQYGGSVRMRPFSVSIDEGTGSIVIAVRGTLSAEDALVDADAEPLDVTHHPAIVALTRPSMVPFCGLNKSRNSTASSGAAASDSGIRVSPLLTNEEREQGVFVHRAMWDAAIAIHNLIESQCLLAPAMVPEPPSDLEAGTGASKVPAGPMNAAVMDVIVVGHSLGAGVTQMLTILLRVSISPSICHFHSRDFQCMFCFSTQFQGLLFLTIAMSAPHISSSCLSRPQDKYPQTRGFAYSPPGGSVSPNLARALARRIVPSPVVPSLRAPSRSSGASSSV